ncbi:MAG: preprotein translocase subunit YajC, partial [Oscillospiraceae bacterium]|nr:preprotein translocase subunit YajC [Oscillospiraceae bacterium]
MKHKKIIRKLALLMNTLAVSAVLAMQSITAFAEDAGTASTAASGGEEVSAWGTLISTFLLPILLLVFLYFIMIRPQQKQEKATREMQKNLCVGDEVVTIGGIVGIVLKVNENTETV